MDSFKHEFSNANKNQKNRNHSHALGNPTISRRTSKNEPLTCKQK